MLRLTLLSTLLFSAFTLLAQEISYQLKMSKPQTHYFEVEMQLNNFKEKELLVKMPVWAPGSYLVREFAKNVDRVYAFDENGKPLNVIKVSKNTWKVEKGKSKNVKVAYNVYAFELSVRTSFLDLTHGFVSGSSIFMYIDKYKEKAGKLKVEPYVGFSTITTALPKASESIASDGHKEFRFENYDQLVDCPIEIGNQEEFSFTTSGVKHTVAMYGVGNYEIEKLQRDMAKIVEAATNVFGENPNKEYVFIIHNVIDGQGGLEHTNSTTLSVNRWTYSGPEYLGFLSLVAHEYFHLWNVKRIRPIELGPFDYDTENYTSLLWVMEGFTSYYDELLMLRANFYTKEQYLSKLQSTINYVEGSVGTRVQPVAHASFDAWIKAYRPNENSANTTMTYYSRGAMIASLLDAKIVAKYKGTKCLDDFLQVLYQKYYKKMDRGFSEKEFKTELANFLGENMDDFFAKYIDGTEIPPFNEIFSPVGIKVEDVSSKSPSFGASLRQDGGKLMIRGIRSGSSAEDAGLSVGDEIIGCNGFRVNQNALEQVISSLNAGEKMNLLISREEILYEVQVQMKEFTKPQFQLKMTSESTSSLLRNYMLRTL